MHMCNIKMKVETLTKNYKHKPASVTSEKGTSVFPVPVQTPAFCCSQVSQGAVMCYKCRQHEKSATHLGPTEKNNHFAESEVNS